MRFYKQYFYKKLMTYLAVYIRPDSKLAEIEPLAANVFFKTEQMVVFDPEFRKDKARGLSYINSIEELLEFDADYIMLNGTIHYKRDILALFKQIHGVCTTGTRIVITFYSRLWQPLFKLATRLGVRKKDPEQNWLTKEDVNNLLDLAGFESVIDESRMLIPLYLSLATLSIVICPHYLFLGYSICCIS